MSEVNQPLNNHMNETDIIVDVKLNTFNRSSIRRSPNFAFGFDLATAHIKVAVTSAISHPRKCRIGTAKKEEFEAA